MSESDGIAIAKHHKVLTQEQVDFYMENGYLPLGKVLDDETVALLRREYDAEFERAQQAGNYRNLSINDTDDAEKKRTAPVKMLQIMQMCERNIHFRRYLYNSHLLDIVEDLIGPNI